MIESEPFHDRRNIQVGLGRIIYAGRDGSWMTPGWVLPGGRRTTDEKLAYEMAARIDHFARHGVWPS